jgi:hypothetical protein
MIDDDDDGEIVDPCTVSANLPVSMHAESQLAGVTVGVTRHMAPL